VPSPTVLAHRLPCRHGLPLVLYCNCVELGAAFNLLCLFSACLISGSHAKKQLLLNSLDFKVTNVKNYETLDGVKVFY